MAGLCNDHLACSNCGCVDFEVKYTTRIRFEAAKMKRRENEHYPARFAEEGKVIYECTKCGTTLNQV